MRLRRARCHPRLCGPRRIACCEVASAFRDPRRPAGQSHKVLVFSQFVDHLAILRSAGWKENRVSVSDGSTPTKSVSEVSKLPERRRRCVFDQPESRRHGFESHRRRLRDTHGPLVESGSRGPGFRPGPSAWPASAGDDLPFYHRARSKNRSSTCTRPNATSPTACSKAPIPPAALGRGTSGVDPVIVWAVRRSPCVRIPPGSKVTVHGFRRVRGFLPPRQR